MPASIPHSFYLLNGIWINHFDCVDKKANIKAENTDGVGTPARLSNDEIWLFDNMMDGQIYFCLVCVYFYEVLCHIVYQTLDR